MRARVTDRGLEQLEAMFLRLLEADRRSKEFEALYEEVDRALERALEEERREARAVDPAAQHRYN